MACSAQLTALPVPAEGMLLTQMPSSVACSAAQASFCRQLRHSLRLVLGYDVHAQPYQQSLQ